MGVGQFEIWDAEMCRLEFPSVGLRRRRATPPSGTICRPCNAAIPLSSLRILARRARCLAIKKFAELEKTLAEDPRLGAMWSKAPAGK